MCGVGGQTPWSLVLVALTLSRGGCRFCAWRPTPSCILSSTGFVSFCYGRPVMDFLQFFSAHILIENFRIKTGYLFSNYIHLNLYICKL